MNAPRATWSWAAGRRLLGRLREWQRLGAGGLIACSPLAEADWDLVCAG